MLPDLLNEGLGKWFGPLVCMWLFSSYMTCRTIGERFKWTGIQALQVHRSVQCALFAGVGLFSMGALHGQGKKLHEQCSDDVFIQAIITYFLWYFVSDLAIIIALKNWRKDLLIHHGVALTGIISLVANKLYPCSSAPVAVTELISLFSGIESMLPKPDARSKGEESVFYVIRAYRLAVLLFIRPFLWQHVRNSAEGASSPLTAAVYLIPGTALPLLDIYWAFKISKSLFPSLYSSKKSAGSISASSVETDSPPSSPVRQSMRLAEKKRA